MKHFTIRILYALLFLGNIGCKPIQAKQLKSPTRKCEQCSTCTPCAPGVFSKQGYVNVPDSTINGQFVPSVNIFTRIAGAYVPGKPTIVFLHCLECSGFTFVAQQQALSAAGYSTIALDLRGRGNSVPKTDPSTFAYTNQAMANDVHTVLVKLGIQGPIIMVGSVSGGYVVLKYFELFSTPSSSLYDPNRTLSKMSLINSGPGLTTVPDCAVLPGCTQDGSTCCITSTVCPFPCAGPSCCVCWPFPSVTCTGYDFFFIPTFSNIAGYTASACSFSESVFGEPCPADVVQAKLAFAEEFLKTTGPIQLNLYINALAEDLRPVIPTIDIPLLVVYGTISPTNSGASIYLHTNVPGSIIAQFDDIAEQPQITSVSKFNNLLLDFITDKPLASSIEFPFTGCDVTPLYKPSRPIPCTP